MPLWGGSNEHPTVYVWSKNKENITDYQLKNDIPRAMQDSILLDRYSEIPLLRPPKIKASYLLKTLFAKFELFFSSFSTPSVPLISDHLWDCPKVVLKTTFEQSQRWSYYRNFTVSYPNEVEPVWSTATTTIFPVSAVALYTCSLRWIHVSCVIIVKIHIKRLSRRQIVIVHWSPKWPVRIFPQDHFKPKNYELENGPVLEVRLKSPLGTKG